MLPNIEREQVYKRLSLKRKEDLLSHIARTTFEAGNYFFKQREVERYISQYIQNLPNANTDPETLELDSAAVLKSIEAQHGLFVERARGIYSFSHLTFHEYFTARKIVSSCNPYASDDPTLQALVSHLTERHWREVFLLVVEMLPSADNFFKLTKQKIDSLLANDEKLQLFLFWVYVKSIEVNTDYYKPIAIRVFYLCLEYTYGLELFCFDEVINLADRFDVHVQYSPFGIVSLDFELTLYQLLDFSNSLYFSPVCALTHQIDIIFENFKLNEILKHELQQLKHDIPELPDPDKEKEKFIEVWSKISPIWSDKLRKIMLKYCCIGYDWEFSEAQIELLMHYYNGNEFLLECLDSDCYVSREVRQEIEDTLLLPLVEIEKRQQQTL